MIAPGTACRARGAPAYSSVVAAYGRDPVDGVVGWLGLAHEHEAALVLSSRLVRVVVDDSVPAPSRMRRADAAPWCLLLLPTGALGWVLAHNVFPAVPDGAGR